MNDDQIFNDKISNAGNSRKALVSIMEEIDQSARNAKAYLTRLSSEPRESDPVGRDRQTRIRRVKSKLDYLKTEREIVKNKLAEVKELHKSFNHIKTNYRTESQVADLQAFMVAAVQLLDSSTLDEIESMASNVRLLDK